MLSQAYMWYDIKKKCHVIISTYVLIAFFLDEESQKSQLFVVFLIGHHNSTMDVTCGLSDTAFYLIYFNVI